MNATDDIKLIYRQIRPLLVGGILILIPLLYGISGFYSVGAEERGVVMRFGKVIREQVLPGMHYHLPWPIESVRTLPTTALRTLEVDFSGSAPTGLQPELTTGDEDLVNVALLVQYNISAPGRYLSSAESPEAILEQLVMAGTLGYVGSSAIDPLLTVGRTRFQNQLKNHLQSNVDDWQLGLRITSVQIRRLEPPASIKPAFDDVARARSEKQKLIQESAGERNTRLAQARGEVSSIREQASAEATETLETALGHRDRFLANWEAYQQSPRISRQRLYLERLERILAPVELIIADPVTSSRQP